MTLHTKYRPSTFDEVIGQSAAVRVIKQALESKTSQAFLLNGPAGTGKTTLARIIAHEFGCDELGINEIDGATNTGIDAMRAVMDAAQYRSLDGVGKKCYIIDECHMLSRNAWNSLLKILEEPPAHVMWVLCTTEPTKVLLTVRSRCLGVALGPVGDHLLDGLVVDVAQKEGLDIPAEVLELVVEEAGNSPRRALVNLGKVIGVEDRAEARVILNNIEGTIQEIDFARLLFAGNKLTEEKTRIMLQELRGANAESVRIIIFAYATSCWLGARSQIDATWAARVMSSFEIPCCEQNKIGDIVLRTVRLLQVRDTLLRKSAAR